MGTPAKDGRRVGTRVRLTLLLLLFVAIPALAQNPDYSASIATTPSTVYPNDVPAPTISVTVTNLQSQTSKDINSIVLTLPSDFSGTTGVVVSKTGWTSTISADGLTITATSTAANRDLDGGTNPRSSMSVSFRSSPSTSGVKSIGVVCTHRNGNDISTLPVAATFTVAGCTEASVSNPASQTVTSGEDATFEITASAGATVGWEQSTNSGTTWTPIAGESASSLTLTSVTTSMSGRLYRATATGTCSTAASTAATLTVDPIVTVTSVGPATATYGDASVVLSASVSPAAADGAVTFAIDGTPVGSATLASGAASLLYNPSTLGVGAHAISVSYGGASEYATSIGAGTLTIDPATLTITGPTVTREYGDANPSLDGTFDGAKNGETFTVTGTTSADATSPIGPYAIVPDVDGPTLANYTVVTVDGTLTVEPATLTITAPTLGREYGDANPSLDGGFSGAKNGETFAVTGSTTATETSPIGEYAIVPQASGATLGNYDIVPVNGTLTIGHATLTITGPTVGREYGDANPSLDGSYTGEKNGETFTVTGTTTATETSSFGAYDIVPEVSGPTLSNYSVVPVNGTLTIGKATLTITGPTVNREYGDANPSLDGTFDGAKNGETFTVTGTTSADATSPIGAYAIVPQASGATLGNYDIVPVNGTLSIGQATLTITAPTLDREYGDANPSLDGTFSGAKNGETFTVTGTTAATLTSSVGDYPVTPHVSGATQGNYAIVPVAGTLTITPATLTITAPTVGREYGDANPSLDGSFSGAKNGETFTVTGSTTATETSSTGAYAVIPSVTGPTVANYAIVPVNGTLTIGEATLTIYAPAVSREYGLPNPSLDGTFSGAKNGETFMVTGSTIATETSPVDDYPVIPHVSGATLANYTVVPVTSTLTVTPATLTITAPSPTRYHGTPNPSLDGTFDGARNGESFAVTGTTTATIASPVGTYDVIPAVTGATLDNYTVVPVIGTLTVIPVCPSITGNPSSATVCAGAPAMFTVEAAGTGPLSYQWRRNGDAIPGANQATYSIASVQAQHIGTYDVIVSAYCTPVTSATATLAIDSPVITSQPTDVTVCAGVPATFSVSATALCPTYQWRRNGVNIVDNAEYSGATTATLTVSTSSPSVAGTYDVIVAGVESASATLSVTPTFTASATPTSIAYRLGKMRTISARLTAGSNCTSGSYMLESITANEPINANDIQFATYNRTPADVSFNVASRRNGSSPRIYTIRYKATDAQGRVSYATTTVTVPLIGGMKPASPDEETDAVTGVVGATILEQNVPNPFSSSTDLTFILPVAGQTRVTVYDMSGKLVATLLDEHRDAGLHVVRWNGNRDSGERAESGSYVYRLESSTGVVARTMSIAR